MTILKGVHEVEASYASNHKKIDGNFNELAVMVR